MNGCSVQIQFPAFANGRCGAKTHGPFVAVNGLCFGAAIFDV